MSWLEAFLQWASRGRERAAIEAEVQAEIEHHLACQERELIARGLAPEQARAKAVEEFGDIERVRRDCLLVRLGERVMLKRIHLVATLLLLLAVGVLGWRNHSMLREFATREESLQAEIAARDKEHLAGGTNDRPEKLLIQMGNEQRVVDLQKIRARVFVAEPRRNEPESETFLLGDSPVAESVDLELTDAGHSFRTLVFKAF